MSPIAREIARMSVAVGCSVLTAVHVSAQSSSQILVGEKHNGVTVPALQGLVGEKHNGLTPPKSQGLVGEKFNGLKGSNPTGKAEQKNKPKKGLGN